MLARLEQSFPGGTHWDIFALGDTMVHAVRSYRVHWNHSYKGDLNYRVFETAGCGTALVTDRVPGISDVFYEGREVETYASEGEAVEKTRYLLTHPIEREALARERHARAERCHTYDVRMREFLQLVGAA